MFHKQDPIQRFHNLYQPEPNTGCWLWLGQLNYSGYGLFSVIRGKYTKAHRYSYLIHTGPLLPSLEIDHKCKTRCCVNPDHLQQIPHNINLLNRNRKTHCKYGHKYTADNTYTNKKGYQLCKQCQSRRSKKYYKSKV